MIAFIYLLLFTCSYGQVPGQEKTSFQIAAPWREAYDVRSDIAIVYGMDSSFTERVNGYRQRGYNVQFMTGIAWGNYQDYFTGLYDGKKHDDEGQVERNGHVIGHGHGVPYIVPTDNYIGYFKTIIRKVIDAGINSIYLEEPEFWARAGYSEAFKKEWQKEYGFPWMPPHESPEATYLSSKLKYRLYFHALKEVFQYARDYGRQKGRRVRCYVPTHSLLNYSSWQIVSPEASLAALPGMDGYIAQVWTGTSREPVHYNGLEKERVFENAFLEYGSMLSMTAPTGRRMYFLTDPIEDRARTWEDYKKNYQATFTAQLLYPSVDHYEVMPWPNRIYLGKFRLNDNGNEERISPAYATQVQVMVNVLNQMPLSGNHVNGSRGIGVLVGNSMMFQRFPVHNGYEDPQLANFYGMVMPLLKRGIPVETVHMENLGFTRSLNDVKVLVMSYANMKPLSVDVHKQLAAWVKKGGVLIYYGRDKDPFQRVKEWWNSGKNAYAAPSEHLFELMHISRMGEEAGHAFGKGQVIIVNKDPKELVLTAGSDTGFINLVTAAYQRAAGLRLLQKNYFYLERGPYTIAAVMDEGISDQPLRLKGSLIDLFDPNLPVLREKTIHPGEQSLLFDMGRLKDKINPVVICAASRIYDEKIRTGSYSFLTKSPGGTNNVMRVHLPRKPISIIVKGVGTGNVEQTNEWDPHSRTLLLRFLNAADGVRVEIKWEAQ
jgi:hypothetical protein